MSGPDDADRNQGFLARWSHRKQEARQPDPKQDAPGGESVESSGSPPPQGDDDAPEFDLSSLPTLEELTGSTDISVFLRKGVPEQLRNAALRQSWALDPAIRNYVNPALEYAYDWNAPGGVPGGGELGAGVDVARLVSQIMGDNATETVKFDENPESSAADSVLPSAPQSELPLQSSRQAEEDVAEEKEDISTADSASGRTMHDHDSETSRTVAPQQPLRRHGTAKPIV